MEQKLNVAIVTTSVRQNRVSPEVANWVKQFAYAQKINNANFDIVDIKNFNLPIFGDENATEQQVKDIDRWKQTMQKYDAYIFVVAEYNHSVTGVLKNATDFLKSELANKAAGFVGYGSVGGARAIEGLRIILAELGVACVQRNVLFMLAYDFENFSIFKPQAFHAGTAKELMHQLLAWAGALKTIR